MSRPFFSTSIAELEKRFEGQVRDAAFLEALMEELENRHTDRAARLKVRALQALGALAPPAQAPPQSQRNPASAGPAAPHTHDTGGAVAAELPPH